MDFKEKDSHNYPELDLRPRSSEYPEVYYPPVVTRPESTHALNKDFAIATYSHSPVSELSSPASYHSQSPPPVYQPQERPPRNKRACGFWIWALIILVVLLATTGGIVGGIFGSRLLHPKTSEQESGQGPVDAPNVNATSPAQNETSIATSRFASIASAKVFNETYIQTFYLESTSIKASMFDGEAWTDLGDLKPSISPREKSPLAAVSFLDGGDTQLRVYYFDAKNREIELAGSCIRGGPPCTWSSATMLQASGISTNSSLAVVQWQDPTTGVEVRTMWENTQGKLAGSVFTRGSWSPDIPFVDVLPGTPVAAIVDSDSTPFTIRVWYRDPNAELSGIQYDSTNPGWKSPDPSIIVANTTTLSPYAPIGVGFVPANASSNTSSFYTSLYSIQGDKRPIFLSLNDNGTSYTTSTIDLEVGDDAGGAIAALGWIDPVDNGLRSIRVYYSKDGKIQEMAQKGNEWSAGAVLGAS